MMSAPYKVLILLFTISFICAEDSETDCQPGQCIIDGTGPKCATLNTNSYKELKNDITERFNELKISDISQVHCNTVYEQCLDLAPESGHKQKCTGFTMDKEETCCYMKVKYKGNSKYSCYPAVKDKSEIDKIIKILKKEYVGSEKISIDCSGKVLSLSYVVFFLFLF